MGTSIPSTRVIRVLERFNRTYRDEVLDLYLFESIEQVQLLSDEWLIGHNYEQPHDSLDRVPPLIYLPRSTTIRDSSYRVST